MFFFGVPVPVGMGLRSKLQGLSGAVSYTELSSGAAS